MLSVQGLVDSLDPSGCWKGTDGHFQGLRVQ